MIEAIVRAWQNFYYGTLNRVPDVDFSDIPVKINLKPHYDNKNEVYWVESPDLPDFEATGKTMEELAEHIGDAILVYFDVPYFFAKRYKDGTLDLKDPQTGEVRSIQVSRSNLEKALA